MSMQQVLSTWKSILPYLQVSLGGWQILKFTPLVGIIQGVIGWLLWPLFPGFFPSYALLRRFPGRVFKKVKCVVLTNTAGLTKAGRRDTSYTDFSLVQKDIGDDDRFALRCECTTVSMHYLGDDFKLRYDKPKLFVEHKNNKKMSHYISDIQWDRIHQMKDTCFKSKNSNKNSNKVVFIKEYKDFWEKKGSGNVMTFDEVLDCVIFEKTGVTISRNFEALPVDLCQQSNETISNLLNLVGLFFSVVSAMFSFPPVFSWYFPTSVLLPTVFSSVSAVLTFRPVASWIYGKINMMVCRSLQWIFDKLPYSMRRQVYSLDMWVQNLAPCNDIQFKVVRDTTITVVIGGAAKINEQYLTPLQCVQCLPIETTEEPQKFDCGRSIVIKAKYMDGQQKCEVTLKHTNSKTKEIRVYEYCRDWGEFERICTFLSCVAKTKAGSLKSYDQKKKKVVVRSWRESVRHYVAAGLPEVYTLTLHDVTM